MKRVEEAITGKPKEQKKTKKGLGRRLDPFITVSKAGLMFSRGAMNKLGDSGYVNIYYKGWRRKRAKMARFRFT